MLRDIGRRLRAEAQLLQFGPDLEGQSALLRLDRDSDICRCLKKSRGLRQRGLDRQIREVAGDQGCRALAPANAAA